MNKTNLSKRIASLCLISLAFLSTIVFCFFTFTYRLIPFFDKDMSAKSVELEEYLPFDKNSKIVKQETTYTFINEKPIIDGAAALVPVYSAFVNSLYNEEDVMFDNGDFSSDSKMQYHNTRGAYQLLAENKIDLALLVAPNQSQLDYAIEKGNKLKLTPVGKEAFVFIVNKNNPVSNISKEDISKAFKGEITNWNELGGPNRLINPLMRNKGSGSQSALENYLNIDNVKNNLLSTVFGASLGFSFRYYVEQLAYTGNIKMLSIDNISPNKENISNGTYPFISDIYLVSRENETKPGVQEFINYVLSEDGQKTISNNGYVSLSGI